VEVASGQGGGGVDDTTDRWALGAAQLTPELKGDVWECCLDWHWEDATRRGSITEDRDSLRDTEEEDNGLAGWRHGARRGGRSGASVGGEDGLTHLLLLGLRQVLELDGFLTLLALLRGTKPIIILPLGLGLGGGVILTGADNLLAFAPGVIPVTSPTALRFLGWDLIATIWWSAILSERIFSLARIGGRAARG
jgi:hypothetical protein